METGIYVIVVEFSGKSFFLEEGDNNIVKLIPYDVKQYEQSKNIVFTSDQKDRLLKEYSLYHRFDNIFVYNCYFNKNNTLVVIK